MIKKLIGITILAAFGLFPIALAIYFEGWIITLVAMVVVFGTIVLLGWAFHLILN